MSLNLQLNQPQVSTGLQTFVITIPSTVPGGYSAGGLFNCKVQWNIFNQGLGTGSGAGVGNGLGAGAGGGELGGFALGGGGTGDGATGQGFGASDSGYPQPATDVTSNPLNAAVTSDLVFTVTNTTQSTTIYTSTAPIATQNSGQFTVSFLPAVGDVIQISMSSSNASDKVLNALQSTVAISQGAN